MAPWLGSTFRRSVSAVPPQTPVFLGTGFQPGSTPLDALGLTGCTAHLITETTTLALADSSGAARFSLSIPNIPALAGLDFIDQALVVGVGNNPAHASLTNAMTGFTAAK